MSAHSLSVEDLPSSDKVHCVLSSPWRITIDKIADGYDYRGDMMRDIHDIFTEFKREFSEIHERHEALGKEIHEAGGPLPEKVRWLIKVAVSGASQHPRALETHIIRARESGATDDELRHALLLLIPTVGFPVFMEAYSVFRSIH